VLQKKAAIVVVFFFLRFGWLSCMRKTFGNFVHSVWNNDACDLQFACNEGKCAMCLGQL